MVLRENSHDHLGDVFRAEAPVVTVARASAGELGRDASGHDVGDLDVLVTQVEHHRLTQALEPEFGSVVGRAACEGVLARKAADIDDCPAAPLLEIGQSRARAVEDSGEVRPDDSIPAFEFGSVVGRAACEGVLARKAADIDDCPAAPLLEIGQSRARSRRLR